MEIKFCLVTQVLKKERVMIKRAKITKKDGYKCAPKGHTVETFAFGEIVEGQVAEWAVADHAAQAMFDPRDKPKTPPKLETKQKRKRKGKK